MGTVNYSQLVTSMEGPGLVTAACSGGKGAVGQACVTAPFNFVGSDTNSR